MIGICDHAFSSVITFLALTEAPAESLYSQVFNSDFCGAASRLKHRAQSRRGVRSARDQRPVVEVEKDLRQVSSVIALEREGRAALGRHQPQPQRTDARRRGLGAIQNLGPNLDRIPGETRVCMRPAVEPGDHLRVRQTIETERPRQRNHVPAIDQPLAILAVGGVEMHLGGVLPQARGEHVLGLLDGHPVDVVDLLSDRVIAPAVRLSGEGEIIVCEVEPLGDHQILGRQNLFQLGQHRLGRGRVECC